MYLGKVVELASRNNVYENPLHPYTQALLSAVPTPDPVVEAKRQRIILSGDVPSPVNPPSGCPFHTRCPVVMDVCRTVVPQFLDAGGGHFVACHRINPVGAGAEPAGLVERRPA
jgi:oligopeptide transport system ATP-binding protein